MAKCVTANQIENIISCNKENQNKVEITENKDINSLVKRFSFKRGGREKYYKKVDDMYLCTFNCCSKHFNTEQKIKKHVLSHIYRKKIVCDYIGCNKKFSSFINLKVKYFLIKYRSITGRIQAKDPTNVILKIAKRHFLTSGI